VEENAEGIVRGRGGKNPIAAMRTTRLILNRPESAGGENRRKRGKEDEEGGSARTSAYRAGRAEAAYFEGGVDGSVRQGKTANIARSK